MLSVLTVDEAKHQGRTAQPSRYHILEALEDASQPPSPKPATDPHLGVSVFSYATIDAVVDMLTGLNDSERRSVAAKLAGHDRPLADAFADMLIEAAYDEVVRNGAAVPVERAEVALADYVAGMAL